MLDPRAIAALGIGYGAALAARIGLWPVQQETVVKPKYRTGAGFTVPRAPVIKPVEDEEALLLFLL